MKPQELAKLTQKLIAENKLETLILFGSRADKSARPDSDWNFFGVTRSGKTMRKRMVEFGREIDLRVVTLKELEKMGLDLLPLRRGIVLTKDDKLGAALVSEAKQIYAKGAPKTDAKVLSKVRADSLAIWARKGPVLRSAADRMLMLSQSPEILCRVNGIWFEGMSRFEKMLKRKSPKAHELMLAAFKGGPFSVAADRWVKYCWGAPTETKPAARGREASPKR